MLCCTNLHFSVAKRIESGSFSQFTGSPFLVPRHVAGHRGSEGRQGLDTKGEHGWRSENTMVRSSSIESENGRLCKAKRIVGRTFDLQYTDRTPRKYVEK